MLPCPAIGTRSEKPMEPIGGFVASSNRKGRHRAATRNAMDKDGIDDPRG